MFGLGTTEIALILVIVLVIFGAGKLPEIGGALGRGIRGFKDEMKGEKDAPAPRIEERKDAA